MARTQQTEKKLMTRKRLPYNVKNNSWKTIMTSWRIFIPIDTVTFSGRTGTIIKYMPKVCITFGTQHLCTWHKWNGPICF
ncbi:hypothetical protein Mapa_008012 [Marchantia paleacea]|nr:hypothetical protein Mapa_008012 [Marchantia paleacea]